MQRKFLQLVHSLVFILIFGQLQAQLSGNYNVPINYSSIAAAITALNSQGVSGPVFINISAGYTETAPVGGYALTASGTSLNPITFRKIGIGANPSITAYAGGLGTPSSANQDGIWRLVGSDYVTIDGIDLNDLNLTNPSTMEYGYGFFKLNAGDGCQNNTIQNCVVTLKRVNNAVGAGPAPDGSRAINVVNSTPSAQTSVLTPTSALGSNSANKFYSNTLQNCNIGISVIGYAATSPFTLADTGNEIGSNAPFTGNTIINFGGATAATNPAAAIRTLAQYNISVINNTINNNTGSGVNHVSTLRGVYLNTAQSANASVNGNSITLNSAANTAIVAAIENVSGATAANNTISISNNVISNCTASANTTGSFYGVYNNAASANYLLITNNVFSGLNTKSTTGTNFVIYNSGAVTGVITITNNLISGVTNSASTSGIFYGIFSNAVSSAWLNISSNTFTNVTTFASTGSVYGIYNSGAISNSITLISNTISACSHSFSSSGNYFGIYNGGAGNAELNLSLNVSQNNTLTLFNGSSYLLYNTGPQTNSILFNSNTFLNNATSFNSTGSYYSIYNNAASTADLQINNTVFSGNTNAATTGSIHVIYNRGALTNTFSTASIANNLISNSTFSAGSTAPFLGIYNNGVNCTALSITNNTISSTNWLSSTSARYLLYNSAQVATQFNFNDNTVSTCTSTLNTTGTLNGLLNTGACGSSLNMSNNTFTNTSNTASSGGTYLLFNSGVSATGVITMTNNTIGSFSNTASTSGVFYGIYNTGANFNSLSITNTTFNTNVFKGSTGLIALINNNGVATTSIISIDLSNNTIANCSASITSNAAFYGIYNTTASSQSLSMNTNSFTNFTLNAVNGSNYMIYNSGAITSTYNALSITNNIINNCMYTASGAGGIYTVWNNGVRTQNTSISSNTISNSNWNTISALIYGIANFGAATVSSSLNANLFSNCVFTTNTTGSFYGIYNNNTSALSTGDLSLANNTFTNVLRSSSSGESHFLNVSGVTTNTYASISFSNNLISGCSNTTSAAGSYYGVYNNSASTNSLSITSNTFNGNYIGAFSGATQLIYNRGVAGSLFSNVNINANVISNLTASISSTGAFYALFNSGVATSSSNILSLSANTFTNASILAGSGAVYLIYSTCPTSNSISISSNTISNLTNSVTTTGSFFGINNGSNSSNGSLLITNNVFTNLNSSASNGNRYLIYNSGGITNTLTLSDNLISNCNHTISGTGSFYGINNNSAFSGLSLNINTNTLSLNSTTLTTGVTFLILNSGALSTTLSNVTIVNNVIDGYSNTATTGPFNGLSNSGITTLDLNVSTNTLTNISIKATGSIQQIILNTARVINSTIVANNLIAAYTNSINTTGTFYGINNTMAYAGGSYPSSLSISNNRLLGSALSSSNGSVYFINSTGVVSNTVLSCTISNNELTAHSHTITASGSFYGINNSVITNSVLTLSGNTFSNIASTSTVSARYMINNAALLVNSGNFLNNLISDFTNTVNTTGSYYGINTSGNSQGNLNISSNTFLNHSLTASTGSLIGVSNSGIITNSIVLSNNQFSNLNQSASTSGGFIGITNNAGSSSNLLISNNTFTNINLTTNSGGTYFIFNRAAVAGTIAVITVTNNSVNSNSFTTTSGPFYGIFNSGNSFGSMFIGNNSFAGLVPNSTASNRYFIYNTGLGLSSGTLSVQDNLLSGFNASLNTTGNFYGIFNQGNTLGHLSVLNNTLTSLNLNASSGLTYMIYNSGAVGSNNISDNFVSGITNSVSGTGSFYGISNLASTSNALAINNNTLLALNIVAPTSATYLFYNTGVSTNTINTASLSNNTISNFTLQSTSGNFFAIYNNALSSGTLSMNNNILTNAFLTTTTSSRYLLYNNGPVLASLSLNGNSISNCTSTLNTIGSFYGLNNGGNCLGSVTMNGNNFSNHLFSSTTGSVFVIYNSGSVSNSISIGSNQVSALSHTASTSGGFLGIYNNSGSSADLNVSLNSFTNISIGSTTGPAYFIFNRAAVAGTVAAITVSNNLLSAFDFTTGSGALYGINNTGLAFSNLSVSGNSLVNISTSGSVSPRYLIFNNGVGSSAININSNLISNFTSTLNTTGVYFSISNTGACAGNLFINGNSISNVNLSATSASVYGIHNSATISNSISIVNSGLSNISYSSNTGVFYGIVNTSAPSAFVSVSNNTLTGLNVTNSVSAKYLIYNTTASSAAIQLSGNTISAYSNTLNVTGINYLLHNTGSAAGDINLSNNSLSNLSISNSTVPLYILYNSGINSSGSGGIKINSNSISNLIHTSTSGLFYGLYNTGGSAGTLSFSDNNFSNSAITSSTSNRFLIYNTGSVTSNMSFTNNLISSNTSSANTSGDFFGIYNIGICQGSLTMSSNTFSTNYLETSTGLTYMIVNTASVSNGITMDFNSVSGYSNSTATSADYYGIINSGSLSPVLSMSGNSFSNNVTNATTGNIQLVSNLGLISNSMSFVGNNISQGFSNSTVDYSGTFNGIYNGGGALSSTVSLSNNNFSNIQFLGTSGTGNLYFIQNLNNSSDLTISGNTWTNLNLNHIGNQHLIYNPSSTQASLSVMNNSVVSAYTRTGAAGALFIYYSNGNSPATCTQEFAGNNFSNFTASTQGTGSFYGLYSTDGFTSPFPKKLVHSNIISNISYNGLGFMYGYYFDFLGDANSSSGSAVYNNTVTGISWSGPFYGLYSGTNVSPNHVTKLYSNVIQYALSNGQNANMYGAYLNGNGNGINFYKNKVSDITSNGTSGTAVGINVLGSGNVELSNNLIGNIYTPSTTLTNALNGIQIAGGNSVNLFYNTVLLNAVGSGSNFASNALYAVTTVSLNLKNNIFINNSIAIGSGITTAFRSSSNALANYSSLSNNNLFYAGIPASNHAIFHDGTNSSLTLPAFQTLVNPRENLSVSENSHIQSTVGINPNFLHIDATIPSLTDNGALNIIGITDDVDLQIRQGNVGYSGIGTAPDIGADEFDANLIPCSGVNAGPVIIPLSNVICSGETVYMLCTGSTMASGVTQQWKVSTTSGGPYTNVSGGIGANTAAYTSATLNAGVYYYVSVTTCTNGPIIGTSNELTVTVNQTPTTSITISNQPLCAGQDIQLTASGNSTNTYLWLGPNNFSTSIQSPTVYNTSSNSSGIYTLLVSNANCTSSPVFVSATVNPSPPTFSLTPAASSLCAGSSQTIGASVPVTNPTLNFGSQTYQNSASGYPAPYSVYYGGQKMQILILAGELATAGFTVGSPISSLQFTINSLGANWGNSLMECKDFKIALKSTTTSILSTFETGLANVVGPINYTPVVGGSNIHLFSAPFIWDGTSNIVIETVFSNSIIGTAGNTVIQNNSPTGFQSTLVYRADNQNIAAISAATSSNVNVGFVRPDFTLNGAQVGTYSWTPSNGLSSTNTTSVIASPSVTTIYTASLSNGQCATTSSILINVILTPTVTISPSSTLVCLGNNATLTAGGASSYTWNTNSTATSIMVSPVTNTTYSVTGSNPACPNASTSILISSAPALTLITNMTPVTLCQGQSATLTVSGANSYTWTGGSNSTSIAITPSLTTNYFVYGTNGPGCWASKTILAKVNPIPFISITPGSATICVGQTIVLEASGVFSFTWQPGNSASPIIEISPSVSTIYTVTGVDLNMCVNTATTNVTVDPCVFLDEAKGGITEINLYPNPTNGKFDVVVEHVGKKTICVVNALGSLIFKTETNEIQERIDLSRFNKGVYFVKISTSQGELTKKLIIQ